MGRALIIPVLLVVVLLIVLTYRSLSNRKEGRRKEVRELRAVNDNYLSTLAKIEMQAREYQTIDAGNNLAVIVLDEITQGHREMVRLTKGNK